MTSASSAVQEVPLDLLRHSCAHLMAQAVRRLWPDAKLAIGPTIDNGFYYDFDVPVAFSSEDLVKIEALMRDIAREDLPIVQKHWPRQELLSTYRNLGEVYKVEIIEEDVPDPEVSVYHQGEFFDMCRGPHVASTGQIQHFKLTSVAGAYWRGDEHRPMLQRIYGTAWHTREELEAYLRQLEEARARDHRRLGQELDLYSVQEDIGPGLIHFHPMGGRIRHVIESFWRETHLRRGYELVYSPHIAKTDLWQRTGHLEFYAENMYAPMEVEGQKYIIKPMNCPFHILMYKSHLRSYRDLPMRYAELGTVYRYERSGVLHGLLRVRGFTQDDAHIFCTPGQLPGEIVGVIDLMQYMMKSFGFTYRCVLSTRPEKSVGEPAVWELATAALRDALEAKGLEYTVDEGGGAFYGPKIDIILLDALGRGWQGPTIQVDFNLPERMDVNYIDESGEKRRVVMVHRTVLGSMERFLGNLVEHYKGAFPFWLAPVQAVIVPITDEQLDYGRRLAERFWDAGLRVEVDGRREKMNAKLRDAETRKVPYMLVVGKRELAEEKVALRKHGEGDLGPMPVDAVLARFKERTRRARWLKDFGRRLPSQGGRGYLDRLGAGIPARGGRFRARAGLRVRSKVRLRVRQECTGLRPATLIRRSSKPHTWPSRTESESTSRSRNGRFG
ncbi:threonine--tRNA ligase [bacterium]|nr:threonine--tRNA ligase [bacterium]